MKCKYVIVNSHNQLFVHTECGHMIPLAVFNSKGYVMCPNCGLPIIQDNGKK